MYYIYTIEYYSAIKKNESLPFATLYFTIMPSEIIKTEKDNYCMLSFICGI